MKIKIAILIIVMGICAGELCADTVYLKNGRSITGMIKREDENRVELDIGFGVVGFKMSEVERIDRSDSSETQDIYKKWDTQKLESEQRAKEAKLREESAPKSVSVSKESGHVVVDALLNQKVHASLMLDTGASVILLTKALAAKLGISPELDEKNKRNFVQIIVADGRKVNAQFVMLESVSVQGNEAQQVEAAILTEETDPSMKDGLLGMSFLKRFNFGIDLQNAKLTLQRLQ